MSLDNFDKDLFPGRFVSRFDEFTRTDVLDLFRSKEITLLGVCIHLGVIRTGEVETITSEEKDIIP